MIGSFPKNYPVNKHEAYHAHVYFDEETLSYATQLCQEAGRVFGVIIGKIHERLVGPHPMWSCQITFTHKHFSIFIPWLDNNRNDLTVFVHGLTGNHLKDHTEYAYWLGDSVKLKLSVFGIGSESDDME